MPKSDVFQNTLIHVLQREEGREQRRQRGEVLEHGVSFTPFGREHKDYCAPAEGEVAPLYHIFQSATEQIQTATFTSFSSEKS